MCTFTISIPVYNGEKKIKQAIESCINQNYGHEFEVLVVDNASTDKTFDIIQGYSDKIKIVRNPSTVSMYENHNICLEKARGDYILFCHSDDMLYKNALSILHKEVSFYDFPERFVVWGRSLFRDYGTALMWGGAEINKVLAGISSAKVFLYGGLTPSGTCYSRQSLLNLGGFLYCSHRLAPSDWITMLMLALEGFEFKMVDRLYFQRTFASTLETGTDLKEMQTSWIDAIAELYKKLPSYDFKRLIDISEELSMPALNFYYGCVGNGFFRSRIRKIVIVHIMKKPLLIRNTIARKILFG